MTVTHLGTHSFSILLYFQLDKIMMINLRNIYTVSLVGKHSKLSFALLGKTKSAISKAVIQLIKSSLELYEEDLNCQELSNPNHFIDHYKRILKSSGFSMLKLSAFSRRLYAFLTACSMQKFHSVCDRH